MSQTKEVNKIKFWTPLRVACTVIALGLLAAFGVSVVFLVCYLWYHYGVGIVHFTNPTPFRYVYKVILNTHWPLATLVPFLAIRQMYLGYRAVGCCCGGMTEPEKMATAALYREKHIRLAKWVFPIWLYVSVTGVAVYVMLYHIWPPAGQ